MNNYKLASFEVMERIIEYCDREMEDYIPMFAIKKSYHPDDWYLYMVVLRDKETGAFAVSTCWNETTKCLNHTHYCLKDIKACYDILDINLWKTNSI